MDPIVRRGAFESFKVLRQKVGIQHNRPRWNGEVGRGRIVPFYAADIKDAGAKRTLLRRGAGKGNRTPLCSLGSCRSTNELYLRIFFFVAPTIADFFEKFNRFLSLLFSVKMSRYSNIYLEKFLRRFLPLSPAFLIFSVFIKFISPYFLKTSHYSLNFFRQGQQSRGMDFSKKTVYYE